MRHRVLRFVELAKSTMTLLAGIQLDQKVAEMVLSTCVRVHIDSEHQLLRTVTIAEWHAFKA